MIQRLKLLSLIFSTLLLSFCQDAPNGHRMFGMSRQNQLIQSPYAFTGVPNQGGLLPNEMLLSLLNSRKQQTTPITESPISEINYDNETDSRAACLGKGKTDSDHDGLPDDCDLEHFPNAYNGWIFGGRYFYPDNSKLVLTPEEELKWKEISKKYGGINFSYMSPTSKKIFKKMELFRNPIVNSDLEPFQFAYYELDGTPIRISNLFKAPLRSDLFQETQEDDMYLGLAAGDGNETPFFSRANPATSAYEMTGFGKDIYSLLEKNPKMVVWQTHVIIPANATHLQMAMAHAVSDTTGRRIKPTSALYSVINNNDTLLIKSKLLSNQSNALIGKEYAILSKNPGCITADLKIVAQIDPTGQITPEIPVFRVSDQDKWTTLSQEYFSIVPLGGARCQQVFIDNTGKNNKSIFNIASDASQRVPGVVDFNSSLARPGIINPSLIIDGDTQSLDGIREGLKVLPIEEMNEHQVTEFLKSIVQIDPTTIQDENARAEETEWLAGVIDQAIKQSEEVSKQPNPLTQLVQLEKNIRNLTALDSNSPEYAAAVAQIDALIADLKANPALDNVQKKTLEDLIVQYEAAKEISANNQTANKNIPIQLTKDGKIPLTQDDMIKLNGSGITFIQPDIIDPVTKKPAVYDPKKSPESKRISDAELEKILAHLGERLDDDQITPKEKENILAFLDGLKKKEGVDPAVVDQFIADHADKLHNNKIKLTKDGKIPLTQDDMIKLNGSGITFIQPDIIDPVTKKPAVYDPKKSPESKRISDAELEKILAHLGERLDDDQITPKEKENILAFLDGLKKKEGVDPAVVDQFIADHADKLHNNKIKLTKDGKIPLTQDDMIKLNGSGITFIQPDIIDPVTKKPAVYDPKKSPESKRISDAELEKILAHLGERLDDDQITPKEKENILAFLDGLKKKEGVDPAVVDQFIADHADKLHNNKIKLTKDGKIPLTQDDMIKLNGSGITFIQPDIIDPVTKKPAVYDPKKSPESKRISDAELEKILAHLGERLDDDQITPKEKENILAFLDGLKKKEGVDPAVVDQFIADHADKLHNNKIKLTKDGKIPLTQDDMIKLNGSGITFIQPDIIDPVTKKPAVYDPKKSTKSKRISDAELEKILAHLGERLDDDQITPKEKENILAFLDGLKKKEGVDPAVVDQFIADHADKLYDSRWTPEQLALLDSLDAENAEIKPGLTESLKKWSRGFPSQTANDEAKKQALEKIEKSLLDPTKKDFTNEERIAVVDSLLQTDFIDTNKKDELMFKINARDAFVDANGVYHPDYAHIISLVKVKVREPDGTEKTISAFKFNSTINFKLGSFVIDDNGKNVIDSFIAFGRILKEKNPNLAEAYFRIEAFADATGSAATNLTLTKNRAKSVKDYVIEKTQVEENQITAEGKGIDPEALKFKDKNGKYMADVRFRRVEILFSFEPFTP